MSNGEIRDRTRSAVLASGPGPAEQLRSLVSEYVAFHAEFPLLATIAHRDLHVLAGDALQRVSAIRKESTDLIRAVVDRGNEAAVFRCEQAALAVSAIASMGMRVSAWYRQPGQDPDSLSEGFAAEVSHWMPQFTVAEVANTFGTYALAVVGCREQP